MLRGRIGGQDEEDVEPALDGLATAAVADQIVQRLAGSGFPEDLARRQRQGFGEYVREHPAELRRLATVILPENPEVELLTPEGSDDSQLLSARQAIQAQCREALGWLLWCAFDRDLASGLEEVKAQCGARGVCGAVWGVNDIAYRCHTCEHDPTCAICVPCFQAGDHSTHDYSMIRTSGGCCDCGDGTAWKESGFCSRHRGPGKVPPLSEGMVARLGPVLEAMLLEWKDRLSAAVTASSGRPRKWSTMSPEEKLASPLSMSIISLLLEFCNCSESMLSFTAEKLSSSDIGLLDILLTAEFLLPKNVYTKLHELLYKLLGDPNFKYRFAQTFIKRYPKFLRESLQEEQMLARQPREHSILGSFSVQIFTVPTLTPRLVVEWKLLDMLFGILKDFFVSCIGDDGRFVVTRPAIQERAYMRAVEDVRYVMSHLKVAQYIIHEFPQLCRTWLHFLAFIQGMYPQKRITSIHIEEESEDWVAAFLLETQMANIHRLFVAGTCLTGNDTSWGSDTQAQGGIQVGIQGAVAAGSEEHSTEAFCIVEGAKLSKALIWLIAECVGVLDLWFAADQAREAGKAAKLASGAARGDAGLRRKIQPRVRLARGMTRDRQFTNAVRHRDYTSRRSLEAVRAVPEAAEPASEASEMDIDGSSDTSETSEWWWMGASLEPEGTSSSLLTGDNEWPALEFDVGKQEVSFHIPLHRMLGLLLQKALEEYESQISASPPTSPSGTLLQLFPEAFRVTGLPALLMEHPLRIQVLCSQVHAGMWRRNGHSIVGLCDIYRAVPWSVECRCEDSLELDLFMLQCCASMAPAEEFAGRVFTCFGLAEYFSLYLWKPNEYEPVLAQEMLVLLIRIISERGFCGLSPKESLRRELIQRLAIGDASHSSLTNALPPRLRDNEHMQETLEAVANYKRPHGMQQGKYVLREQSWRELDLYHPRWTPRELQSAEERYLRACKASAHFCQPPRWRKPFLPLQSLSKIAVSAKVHEILRALFFHAAFSPNLSESRAPESLLFTALHLLSLGLDVCNTFANKSSAEASSVSGPSISSVDRPPLLALAPEFVHVGGADGTQLFDRQSTLSLLVILMRKYIASEGAQLIISETSQSNVGCFIKKLLHNFAELDRQCMYAIESLAPEILHRVSTDSSSKAEGTSQDELQAELSDIEKKRAHARERQAAMMAKMRAAQEKFMASVESSKSSNKLDTSKTEGKRPRETLADDDMNETGTPLCALCRDRSSTSPLCMLTLVQKSRLLALSQKPVPSWDKPSRVVDDTPTAEDDNSASQTLVRREAENLILELRQWLEGAAADPNVDRLTNRDDFVELLRGGLPSILNTERFPATTSGIEVDTDASLDDTYGESSHPVDPKWWWELAEMVSNKESTDNNETLITVLAEYVAAVSRSQSELQPQPEDPPRGNRRRYGIESKVYRDVGLDFIGLHLSACGHAAHYECVERYYASLLQRYYSRSLFEGVQIVDPDLGEFLCPVCRRLSNSILPVLDPSARTPFVADAVEGFRLEQACSLMVSAQELVARPGFRNSVSRKLADPLRMVLESVSKRLSALYCLEKEKLYTSEGRNCQGLFLWDLLRYSIMSAELAARTRSLILGNHDAASRLVALEEASEASRGSTLPLLSLAANLTLTHSRQIVLLRSRGMQLMVGSVCHGTSLDFLSEPMSKGHLSSLLHFLEKGRDSADIQFWKRVADPVLAHDPFSSLMCLLYVLPLPIPAREGPLTALVHLFYLVCLVQCLASMGRYVVDDSVPAHLQNFLAVIHATLADTCIALQSPEGPVTAPLQFEQIRLFTLPYLRRCALLQTVISGTSQPVPVAGSNSWELSNVYNHLSSSAYREAAESSRDTEAVEMKEVEELERRFSIPPMQAILSEEAVQNLVVKWCQHLQSETGSRSFSIVPRPVRAVALQLMVLPRLFQDLIQRYVKECCPRCKTVPERPVLCLLCGRLCCGTGTNGCCSVQMQSECYRHAISCGGGVGVYLMLRKTNVLLLRRERQTMWPSPYLDAYGEEDQDMRRGKPLFLSDERYAALTAMVASHSLDYSSSVLAQTIREPLF
ncbi:E3 ubiquitin-protein ligase PRT6 [Selaginella moellendorffii]|uniref:E3 ubiquitin-protein ligase PRT6 n=1 Tax=Selaginella moellendorffii TaxID=88036 RepID=UPI000D1C7F04|nr:E3 ubiquitin-protein ligase PRT6 [Selaginella moellendorffii]|eukprot:XP_024515044.1 E3 ubiquitin-protein ligase PRT6 [Selaginella moellendorffii]